MNYITDALRSKVTQMWKEEGERWLDALPGLIEKYRELWGLSELTIPSTGSIAFVGLASSSRYGDVALKIGFPHREMYTGMDAMIRYKGRLCCRLYEADRTDCAMLMERIVPGNTLKEEPSFLNRIRIGAQMATQLPLPIVDPMVEPTVAHSFPAHIDLMNKAFHRARIEQRAGKEFLDSLMIAEKLYAAIQEQQRPQVLLHGDLHHENILLEASGNWRVIDPQGRIGERILEVGRFFQNEWDMHGNVDAADCMESMLMEFADAFGEEVDDIAASCYLDCALSACWSFEDGSGTESIGEALVKMRWLENFLNI